MVLSHFLPLEVGMPSALRVLAMSRVLLPWRAMSKMRRATASAGGFSSSLGRFFGPVLDVDPLVAVGGVGGHPEASRRGSSGLAWDGLLRAGAHLLGEEIESRSERPHPPSVGNRHRASKGLAAMLRPVVGIHLRNDLFRPDRVLGPRLEPE